MNEAKTHTEPIVRINGLNKHYDTPAGRLDVLVDVDMSIYPGEIVAIMGPSGSGKSSMLLVLGLLQPPTSGACLMLGQDVFRLNRRGQAAFRREHLGFVFQSANMFEYSSVYENLEYPLIYSKVPRLRRRKMIMNSLEMVNMGHRANHPTNRLSGGEQQRVAIARALVNKPTIILGDEPTGQLDTKNGRQVMKYFKSVVKRRNTAMILVTHDPKVAAQCTRAFVLHDGKLRLMKKDEC